MEKKSNQKAREINPSRKVKIITQFDPSYKGAKGETNGGTSKTTPDMSLSVKTLLSNHTRGINSQVHNYDAQYFDSEIPQFDDITDMIKHKEELNDRLKELETDLKKEKEAKIKADKEKKDLESAKKKKEAQIDADEADKKH